MSSDPVSIYNLYGYGETGTWNAHLKIYFAWLPWNLLGSGGGTVKFDVTAPIAAGFGAAEVSNVVICAPQCSGSGSGTAVVQVGWWGSQWLVYVNDLTFTV